MSFDPLKITPRSFFRFLAMFATAFFLYAVVTAFIYRERLPNLTTHYAMPDVDTDGGMWYQWYLDYIHRNNKIYDVVDVMSFPVGYDIAFSPVDNILYSFQAALLGLSPEFQWQHLVLITNLSTLVTYPLLGSFTFAVGWLTTKKFLPSLAAGWFAAFSYYFLLMGRGQMSINHTWWVPLYLSLFLMFLRTKVWFWGFFSALIFAIMFQADAYYAFFSGIFSGLLFLSYYEESWRMRIKRMAKYYGVLFGLLVLLNLNFLVNNLYQFNTDVRAQTGRLSSPENELVTPLTYFSVFENTVGFSSLGKLSHLLYLVVIGTSFSGIWVVKKYKREYRSFALAFIAAVVLSVKVPFLSWIHDFYFQYFGMFRGVGRLNVFGVMFLGLMVAIVLSELAVQRSWKRWQLLGVISVLCGFFLFCTYPDDHSWRRQTNMAALAELYAPITNDPSVTAVATYPMTLGAISYGFPSTYQLIGQVLYQKPLASGVSPFDWETRWNYESVSDISSPDTIAALQERGINTIIIHNQLLKDSETITATLSADPRIEHIGDYSFSEDIVYYSTVDRSMDISVFQVRDVKRHVGPLLHPGNGQALEFNRRSPYHYTFHIPEDTDQLVLEVPFSSLWRLYDEDERSFVGLFNATPLAATHHTRAENGNNVWNTHLEPGEYSIVFSRSFTRDLGKYLFRATLLMSGITLFYLGIKRRYEF